MDTSHGGGAAPEGHARIAGFWRRLAALFIDWMVMSVPCFMIAYAFMDKAIALGDQGRIIGYSIALTYFSLLNSSLYDGQTPGKWVMGLRLVGASGEPISILRTIPRTIVLLLPFALNGVALRPLLPAQVTANDMQLFAIESLIVFGFGACMFYLFLFNRMTRQALHDLLVESYVVRTEPVGEVTERIWIGHVAIVLGFLVLGTAAPMLAPWSIEAVGAKQSMNRLDNLRDALLADPTMPDSSIGVSTETTTFTSVGHGTHTTSYLIVVVRLPGKTDDTTGIMLRVAKAVLAHDPKILGQDELRITVEYGFDLGITKFTQKDSDSATPEDWRKKFAPMTAPADPQPQKT